MWEKMYPDKFRNLFVNWHLGVLGHEVLHIIRNIHNTDDDVYRDAEIALYTTPNAETDSRHGLML